MHNLAMLAEDSGKAITLSQAAGDTIDLTSDKTLSNAWANEQLGCGMHRITHLARTLDGFNLLRLLGGAHLDYSLDQSERGGLLLLRRMDAHQIHDLNLGVEAVGGEEVDLPVGCDGVAA